MVVNKKLEEGKDMFLFKFKVLFIVVVIVLFIFLSGCGLM